jgi:hypothetical protein
MPQRKLCKSSIKIVLGLLHERGKFVVWICGSALPRFVLFRPMKWPGRIKTVIRFASAAPASSPFPAEAAQIDSHHLNVFEMKCRFGCKNPRVSMAEFQNLE